MGLSTAGLAFPFNGSQDDILNFLPSLFNGKPTFIQKPNWACFSIHDATNVIVRVFPGVCFIENTDLVLGVLADPTAEMNPMYESLGRPSTLWAYCYLDGGGTYGYAVMHDGVRIRSRLQTTDDPGLPPVLEVGTPLPFEKFWMEAPFFMEDQDDTEPEDQVKVYYQERDRNKQISEHYLTAQMLREGLESTFGFCPWDDHVASEMYCYEIEFP